MGYTNKIKYAKTQSEFNTKTEGILCDTTNPTVIDNHNSKNKLLPSGPCQEADKMVNAKVIEHLQKEFNDVFTGIGCFDACFH